MTALFNPLFWQDKKVLITGHTGFKGAWLSVLLHTLGSKVTGYALKPEGNPNLFEQAQLASLIDHHEGDVRSPDLQTFVQEIQPDIIFHLAAQSLVPKAYQEPVETFATNVMGTVNLLEAVRHTDSIKACVVVTSDKCYQISENHAPLKETDKLGGDEPYAASKACAELVTQAYQQCYTQRFLGDGGARLATVRSGNVFGGGDWTLGRLIPDIWHASINHESLILRHPHAVRPWQHVLAPLSGYLQVAALLCGPQRDSFASSWNFGPPVSEQVSVSMLISKINTLLEIPVQIETSEQIFLETSILQIDSSKANKELNWHAKWSLEQGLKETIQWYLKYHQGINPLTLMKNNIKSFYEMRACNDEV